jgi:hypothetical protein
MEKLYLHQKLIYRDAIWPDHPVTDGTSPGTGK